MRFNITIDVTPTDADEDELEAFQAALKATLEDQFSADPTQSYQAEEFEYEVTYSSVVVTDSPDD